MSNFDIEQCKRDGGKVFYLNPSFNKMMEVTLLDFEVDYDNNLPIKTGAGFYKVVNINLLKNKQD
jgi:hypothetical protein